MTDLPDYTRYIAVNVEIPPSESGPSYVGKYQVAPADLTDGQLAAMLLDIKGRLYVIPYEKDRTVETLTGKFVRIKGFDTDHVKVAYVSTPSIIPKPEGAIPTKGSLAATSGTYQNVVAYTVTNTKTFHLSKIVCSCDQDSWVKILWDGSDVSVEYLITAGFPFTDWFPWDWQNMQGDGVKQVVIQGKQKTTSGVIYGEIVGEEV